MDKVLSENCFGQRKSPSRIPTSREMAMKLGPSAGWVGGSNYVRMAQAPATDMSNRPATGWSHRTMSTIMKIGVMIFVTMLCLVGFVGAFGLIMGSGRHAEGALPGIQSGALWLVDLKNPTESPPGHLIFSDPQADLERPSFVQHFKKEISEKDPFAALANERIAALSALKSRNLTFIINVIGWRRRASLKRLVTSLEAANYHGFNTRLHFHLDGEAHPLVKEYVEEYTWPHGKTMMNIHTERLGLESTIVNSWDGRRDDQLAFFFEDDIEVSPHYFEYTILVLHKYIFPDPNGPRSSSFLAQKMMGVALNTPRFNEIVFPPYRWVPQHVIGQEDYQFAFQLANSWGCLYFPWVWREYRQYYDWRRSAGIMSTEHIVPASFINQWVRSWKKSLIELSYFRGYYMVYPNLPGQHGFSIHHREPGEHTRGSAEVPKVDQMEDLYLDYFTVPLVTNQRDINRLYATMKPLGELPVVNFHHSAVKSVYDLPQDGLPAVEALERHGFDFDLYNPNPGCLLDNLTPPIVDDGEQGEKYLIFQGQGSAYDQLIALENAFAYAKILNRTLVIPPLTYENKAKNKFQLATWDWLIDLKKLTRGDSWAPARTWEDFSDNTIWLDRIVEYRPPAKSDAPIWQFNDKLFDKTGVVPMRDVVLPRVRGSSIDLSKAFGRCHDKYLGFRSMISTFHFHDDPIMEGSFRQWAHGNLALKQQFIDVFNGILQTFNKPFACLTFTKGDNPENCGRGVKFPSEELGRLISYRSCNATAPRTIEYLMETAGRQGVRPLSIYIFTDAGTPPVAIPTSIDGGTVSPGRQIPIMRSNIVFEALRKCGVLHPDIKHMIQDVQQVFEDMLCTEADVFLGNQYSEVALRVARVRRALGKKSELLGYGSDYIF